MALALNERATLTEIWTMLAVLLPTIHILPLSTGIVPLHVTQKWLNNQKEAQLASMVVINSISSNFTFG
jgi:hypothetical protein